MCKFTLIKIDSIEGKQVFEKLVIDGCCLFDQYEDNIKYGKKYTSEIGMIYKYMEFVANLNPLPDTKFRDITPDKETVKEYEFKTKHLRVYAIKKENGKIIILGGFKNSQKADIRKFRAIKKLYLNNNGHD